MRLRTDKEFAIALACYGVAMVALAFGIAIASGPIQQPNQPRAIPTRVPAACASGGGCVAPISLTPVVLKEGR